MKIDFKKIIELKNGLSNKKIYRKIDKNLNKIVIDFSNDKKEFFNYLKIYNILKKLNISVPQIYEVHFKSTIIVMEDFGDKTFNILYTDRNLYNFLKVAVDNLIIIQNSLTSDDIYKLDKYSFYNLKLEISEFVDHYIPYKKIKNFPRKLFFESWKNIFNSQNFEFSSFVHKDFEFINLIYLNKNINHLKCGIIDFQNAYQGFIGWDLFSILENPRINFSNQFNEDLIRYFYDNVNMNVNFKTFLNQYYILNLARQTRLLGRWIKLLSLENNLDYLKYSNITEKRIISCLENIEDLKLKPIYEKVLEKNA